MAELRSELLELFPRVVSWRRHLHRYPELSHREVETTQYVTERLEEIGGFTLRRYADTGIVADLVGGRPGKTVALRADIDALPVLEATDLPFASAYEGMMHACGHDMHMAMLLGAAAWLAAYRETLPGRYRLIFQAAEEVVTSGAEELVDEGVMEGVDYILGQHVMPEIPTGQIAALSGPAMAAVGDYYIDIYGQGGHASQPHQCLDPIPIAASVVEQLQTVVSRLCDPLEPLVVSNTVFQAGNVVNVIPDKAHLEGTVRTFDDALRERALERIRDIALRTAEAYGAKAEVELQIGHDATLNDAGVAALVRDTVREAWGEAAVAEVRPYLAAEDFSAYLHEAPGAFFFLGVAAEGKAVHPLHHPRVYMNEEAMLYGMETLIRAARKLAVQGLA